MADDEVIGDDEQREESVRFQQQCFFTTYLDLFCGKNSGHPYPNFAKLYSGGSDTSSSPQAMVQKLVSPGNVGYLMNATPAEVSALVPRIKVYKVFYPNEDGTNQAHIEIPFDDHMDPSSVENITARHGGRVPGNGIKSFEWELAGSNPAEASRVIEAKMKLRFSSLDDMFTLHTGIADENGGLHQFRFLEMFNPSAEGRILRAGGYNPEYFRFKVVVGYAPLPANYGENITTPTEDLATFREAVLNATSTYFLNYTGHEIDFKNDGSCEVTIDYIAAAEGSLDVPEADALLAGLEGSGNTDRGFTQEPGLFSLSMHRQSPQEQLGNDPNLSVQEQMAADAARLEEMDDELADAKEQDACTGGTQRQGWLGSYNDENHNEEEVTEDQERERENIAIRNMYNRNIIYGNMMEQLYNRNGIFSITLENEQIEEMGAVLAEVDMLVGPDFNIRGGQLTDRAAAERRAERGRDPNPSWANQVVDRNDQAAVAAAQSDFASTGGRQNLNRQLDGIGTDIADRGSLGIQGAERTAEHRTEDVDRLRDRQTPDDTASTKEKMFYFYYGDLLDVALSVLRRDEAPRSLKELRPVVGPIRISDPFTQEVKNYCLADIPISLELFNVWFLDKVVKPEREKYALKDFIKDTITTLIGPALSPRCFGNEMRGTRTRVSMTTVNAPFADGPKDRMSNQPSEEPFGNILVTEIQPFPTGENSMGLMSGDYFIVYANSQGARSLNAWEPSHAEAEARDAEEGIPWIKMGCDRGLTKKVKFKKMEIPGMRESHMTNPTDGGDTPNYRPMPYNVDVEMFGNSIFKPGMMLYVDPAMVVSSAPGATFDAIKGMGLGGYYTVLKAKGAIERGKFSTDVECIFTAFGDGQPDPNTPEESCGDDGDTDGMPTAPADMEMP